MKILDVTDDMRSIAAGRLIAAAVVEIPIIEISYKYEYSLPRRMDLFEEHVMRLCGIRDAGMTIDEISTLLGCHLSGFVIDAISSLEDSHIVARRTQGHLERFIRGPRYADTHDLLVFDEEGQTDEQRLLYQWHTDKMLTHVCPAPPSESINQLQAEAMNAEQTAAAKAKEWHESAPWDATRGRLIAFVEPFTFKLKSWRVNVFVEHDEHKGEWFTEAFDTKTLEREGDALPYIEQNYRHDLKRALDKVLHDEMLLCPPAECSANNVELSPKDSPTAASSVRSRSSFHGVVSSTRSLETVQARNEIKSSIENARHEVIISLPFVNQNGIRDFEQIFRDAIKQRGVQIVFLWGIAESESEEMAGDPGRKRSADRAIKKLRSIRNDKLAIRFAAEWRSSDHTKWIMIDRRELFTGSYNFLSYRPEPHRESMKVRREEMVHFVPIPALEVENRIKRLPQQMVSLPNLRNDDDRVLQDVIRSLRIALNPESVRMVAKYFKQQGEMAQAAIASAICRGGEMALTASPHESKALAAEIRSLFDAATSCDYPCVGKSAHWRSDAISFNQMLQSIGESAVVDVGILG